MTSLVLNNWALVIKQYCRELMCLAQGHNLEVVALNPGTSRSDMLNTWPLPSPQIESTAKNQTKSAIKLSYWNIWLWI